MKAKAIETNIRDHVLDELPGFRLKGNLLYEVPLDSILRGIYFENSSTAECVYLWCFVQPLYIPSDNVYFTFGFRLRRRITFFSSSELWCLRNPESYQDSLISIIRNRAIPFFGRLRTPDLVVQNLARATGQWGNVFVNQAVAFSRVVMGECVQGKSGLKEVIEKASENNYAPDVAKQAEQLLRVLEQDRDQALKLLVRWQTYTLNKLGLG